MNTTAQARGRQNLSIRTPTHSTTLVQTMMLDSATSLRKLWRPKLSTRMKYLLLTKPAVSPRMDFPLLLPSQNLLPITEENLRCLLPNLSVFQSLYHFSLFKKSWLDPLDPTTSHSSFSSRSQRDCIILLTIRAIIATQIGSQTSWTQQMRRSV